ncbi:MAG: MBL fold metallo-hydrolase [Propionivibrio sp.]
MKRILSLRRPRFTPFRRFALFVLLTLLIVAMTTSASHHPAADPLPARSQSAESLAAQQNNLSGPPQGGLLASLGIFWDFLFNKPADTTPEESVPVVALTRAELIAAPDNTLFRLGHSTVLLKLHGEFWLTDPVFSERASPFSRLGPKRFHAPPISIDELPPIKAVILSHDHYDHLDYAAILQLAPKVEHFVAPLGVGDRLLDWGVPAAKVRQFDWWQETTIAGVRLVATPAQHFSGRSLLDANSTLWSSWVIIAGDVRVFFSGDSGYFDGFRQIGERFGPFDLTLIETGAYDKNWPAIHMQPEESLQAHLDLRGRRMLPIHNGTFDLAMHAWYEPLERIAALTTAGDVPLSAPRMGEAVSLRGTGAVTASADSYWWRAMLRDHPNQSARTTAAIRPTREAAPEFL